jgi:hypothetical protein
MASEDPGGLCTGKVGIGWCLYGISTSDLSVPFPTPLEAEIACGALAPDAEPHRAVLGKELTVSGSILAV